MDDGIEKILEISLSLACRSRDQLLYALYLTISMEHLCASYFQYFENTGVRNEIVKHIIIKRDNRGISIPISFIDQLLIEFKSSIKNRRVWIGTAIKDLKDSLTLSQIKDFFTNQVLSERILDRKRAYNIATHNYDSEIDSLLWSSWRRYKDNNCMAVLAQNTDVQLLADNFEPIWKSNSVKFYIKNNVLKRVAKFDFNKVLFLRDEKPISYLSACVASEKQISDEEAILIAKSSDSIGSLGYCFWCLGMLGKNMALYQILAEIETLESNLPAEFWEYLPINDSNCLQD